jgi:hypothetical protein
MDQQEFEWEQKKWRSESRHRRIQLLIEIAGFAGLFYGLVLNARTHRLNVENGLLTQVIALDTVFMNDPELEPYFYENTAIAKNHPKYLKAHATAGMFLDIFDIATMQKEQYPSAWDTPQAWDEWMEDVFSSSPILQEVYNQHRNWYGLGVQEKFEGGLKRQKIKGGN